MASTCERFLSDAFERLERDLASKFLAQRGILLDLDCAAFASSNFSSLSLSLLKELALLLFLPESSLLKHSPGRCEDFLPGDFELIIEILEFVNKDEFLHAENLG